MPEALKELGPYDGKKNGVNVIIETPKGSRVKYTYDEKHGLFRLTKALPEGMNFPGQTHVHRYLKPLLERVQKGEIDPGFVITHRLKLDQAPEGFELFKNRKDECIKVVLTP